VLVALAGIVNYFIQFATQGSLFPFHLEYLRHLLRLVIVIPSIIVCFLATVSMLSRITGRSNETRRPTTVS
jgi:hypothetical protein